MHAARLRGLSEVLWRSYSSVFHL